VETGARTQNDRRIEEYPFQEVSDHQNGSRLPQREILPCETARTSLLRQVGLVA
jgi:hypothetical protein